MALIIKAQMPKGCCWELESGCFDICKFRKVCGRGVSDKPLMTGYRHRDCPIIGEIPDKHGDLIDEDEFRQVIYREIRNHKEDEQITMILKGLLWEMDNAPVIVEATE